MKIFISYGHNDHVSLVDKLFDALIQAGHEPWKDDRYEGRSGIAPGEEFTSVIYNAIDESDFVIAFVSEITRVRPYCIGERNYAYNRKGNHFIQIRLDHTDIRLGNEQSYVDMSDIEETTGEINERLFEEQLNKLFSAFRDPSSFAQGGFTPWAKFERHLKVPGSLQYDEFITMPDIDDFVGRRWLSEKCKRWVNDSSIPCRLFVIYGEAGTGKTAFVRHLAQDKELVRSVHVCIYDRPRTRTVEDTLKDLAYVLAKNNDAYFNFLKNKDFSTLDELGIDGLFEFLFLEPLKTESQKFLIIIDGLDELDEKKGFDPLIKLFRQYTERINPNISFIVTGRPDNNIVSRIRTVGTGKAESITLDIKANNDDLIEYIEKKLRQKNIYTEKLAEKILDACDGNFEYLALLFKEVDEGLVLSEQMNLPEGLYSRYTQYIERRFEVHGLELRFSKLQRRLMSVLCAVYEPIPLPLLADILREDEYDIEDEIRLFGSLVRQQKAADGDIMISLFTKGFRDYLTSKVCREFQADYQKGNAEIAEFVIERFRNESDYQKDLFIDNNGMAHVLAFAAENPDTATKYIEQLFNADKDRVSVRISAALKKSENEAIRSFVKMKVSLSDVFTEVQNKLIDNREIITLTQIKSYLENLGYTPTAYLLSIDLLLLDPSPEAYLQAEEICCKLLELDSQSFIDNPDYKSRRNLSVTYQRLGDIAKTKNTPEGLTEAEAWYRKALELDKQNYRDNPCYQSRRNLSVTYQRLGDIAKTKNTPEELAEAEAWYHKLLELTEQNYRDNPCYQSRGDLSVTYQRLGDIAKTKNAPEGLAEAEVWYRKELELYEQNYRDNPCYQSRWGLSVTYQRLGDIAKTKNTPEGLAEAEAWHRKALELDEQNYRDNPCYQSRGDLSVTYQRLGDIAKTKNTPEGLTEAEAWYCKALELDKQNYRDNPCYQSRRNLSVTYRRLGDIAKTKNTPEWLAEAEAWYRKILELAEQNYRDNPCYQSRWDLSVTYQRLGDIAKTKNTPEGLTEAEAWHRKVLELAKQNYRDNPCYQSRRDLLGAYFGLGDISEAKSTPEGLTEAEAWYRKALEPAEQNYRDNPCYQSRWDLSVTYQLLGDIAKTKNTPEGLAEVEAWYRKALEPAEQNYRDNPCYQSEKDLLRSVARLYLLVDAKKTPESKAEAAELLNKLNSL